MTDSSTRIRLACADSAFPRLTHAGALTVIRDLGIGAVDICVFASVDHNPPAAVKADPAGAAERVGQCVADHGLRVSDVFAEIGESFDDLAVNHPDEAIRAQAMRHFEALVDFARRLDAPGVTILPGTVFDDEQEQSLALAAAELERRAWIAADAGLRFAIEPHVGSVVPTPDRTLALLERTEHVGLTLDLSHFAYQGIPQHDARPLLPYVNHVHLRQAGPGSIQARVPEGTIDFPAIRDDLLSSGYEGYFALEYQWQDGWLDFTRVDNISESAALRDLMLEG
jgi:sugar phosphate isomerase/epimerase